MCLGMINLEIINFTDNRNNIKERRINNPFRTNLTGIIDSQRYAPNQSSDSDGE